MDHLKSSNIISIIIPCFNSEETLPATIDSIYSLIVPNDYSLEIIAIDNNSTDNTKNIIRSYSNIIYLYESKRNRSVARNRGIEKASGSYLCFVDSDTVLAANWLLLMIEKINSSRYYGGGEGYIDSGVLKSMSIYEEVRKKIKEKSHIILELQGRRFPGINTAACIYRKEALLTAGCFDVNLGYHEDIDLSQKVFRSGYVLFSEPRAKAICYNSEANLRGLLKRNFISAIEYLKFEYKWTEKLASSILKGFLGAQLTCIRELTQELLSGKIKFTYWLIRSLMYISSVVGGVFGSNQISLIGRGRKQLPIFFSEESSWGVIELTDHYVLYNTEKRLRKVIPKLFTLNQLLDEKNNFEVRMISKWLSNFENHIHSVYIVGSHNKKEKDITRNDIDIVIITNSKEGFYFIEKYLKKVKPYLNNRFDLSVFDQKDLENISIFHRLGIHAAGFSLKQGRLLWGKEISLENKNEIMRKSFIFIFFLLLKKVDYYIFEKKFDTFLEFKSNQVDLIFLFKFIKFNQILQDSRNNYVSGIDLVRRQEIDENRDLIENLISSNFNITIDEYEKVKDVLKELTKENMKKLLSFKNLFWDKFEIEINKRVLIDPVYFDYSFLKISKEETINSCTYKELFIAKLKEIIKKIEAYCE